MNDKTRRDVISLLGAGVAATAAGMLSKTASAADPPKEVGPAPTASAKKYLSITVAAGPQGAAVMAQVQKAISEALASNKGPAVGGLSPVSDWSQDGGWFQDVTDPWSQAGGWVLVVNGQGQRLGAVEARSAPALVNVRSSLKAVTMQNAIKLNTQ